MGTLDALKLMISGGWVPGGSWRSSGLRRGGDLRVGGIQTGVRLKKEFDHYAMPL